MSHSEMDEFSLSLFRGLASVLTVREIQTPLGGIVEANEPVASAWKRVAEKANCHGYDPLDRVYLVTDKGEIVGWLPFEFLEIEGLSDPAKGLQRL